MQSLFFNFPLNCAAAKLDEVSRKVSVLQSFLEPPAAAAKEAAKEEEKKGGEHSEVRRDGRRRSRSFGKRAGIAGLRRAWVGC